MMNEEIINSPITDILSCNSEKGSQKEKTRRKPLQKKIKKRVRNFTKEEDQLLLLQIVRYGKRFEAIAKHFPRRSKHELKNRYYTQLKNRESELFIPDYYDLNNIGNKKQEMKKVSKDELHQKLLTTNMDITAQNLMTQFVTQLDSFFSLLGSNKWQ